MSGLTELRIAVPRSPLADRLAQFDLKPTGDQIIDGYRLVAKDILPALAYRVMREGGSCLRANRVPPYHMHKARLSDAHGQASALLVHPDALPEWMSNAETTRRSGPRKFLAPTFMAWLTSTGLPALLHIEAAHAEALTA